MGLIALLLGVIRKGGFPQLNIDYFQSVVLDENVQMLGFLMIASTAGMFSLVCWGPVFIHAALICSKIVTN